MALDAQTKQTLIKEFQLHETDTGSPEAVSYTHLDVYKRQVLTMTAIKSACGIFWAQKVI